MIPHQPYLNPENFPQYTALFSFLGVCFTLWFLVREINLKPSEKNFIRELSVIVVSSFFLGFGFIGFLLSCNINL